MYKSYSMILNELTPGYGIKNNKPLGYCKIICNEKMKVELNVKNLDNSYKNYECYIIYNKEKYFGKKIGNLSTTIISDNAEDLNIEGFAVTDEAKKNKVVLYGSINNKWDGKFEQEEEIDGQTARRSEEKEKEDGQTARQSEEKGKEDGQTVRQSEVQLPENCSAGPCEVLEVGLENDELPPSLRATSLEDGGKMEKVNINEAEYTKTTIDKLIEQDKLKWDIYKDIKMYIGYKKFGYVLYKEDDNTSTIAVPTEGENVDYLILEWQR